MSRAEDTRDLSSHLWSPNAEPIGKRPLCVADLGLRPGSCSSFGHMRISSGYVGVAMSHCLVYGYCHLFHQPLPGLTAASASGGGRLARTVLPRVANMQTLLRPKSHTSCTSMQTLLWPKSQTYCISRSFVRIHYFTLPRLCVRSSLKAQSLHGQAGSIDYWSLFLSFCRHMRFFWFLGFPGLSFRLRSVYRLPSFKLHRY